MTTFRVSLGPYPSPLETFSTLVRAEAVCLALPFPSLTSSLALSHPKTRSPAWVQRPISPRQRYVLAHYRRSRCPGTDTTPSPGPITTSSASYTDYTDRRGTTGGMGNPVRQAWTPVLRRPYHTHDNVDGSAAVPIPHWEQHATQPRCTGPIALRLGNAHDVQPAHILCQPQHAHEHLGRPAIVVDGRRGRAAI